MTNCLPYLLNQIEIIDPTFICCLGRIAAQALLRTSQPLGKLRGKWHDFMGRRLIVTYHPAALLRFPQYKRGTWEDVQELRRAFEAEFGE
jgi:DNA polymerase